MNFIIPDWFPNVSGGANLYDIKDKMVAQILREYKATIYNQIGGMSNQYKYLCCAVDIDTGIPIWESFYSIEHARLWCRNELETMGYRFITDAQKNLL